MPVAAASPAARAFGVLARAMPSPSPASCDVLGVFVSAGPAEVGAGVLRSDVQYFTRCTELSKLLWQRYKPGQRAAVEEGN